MSNPSIFRDPSTNVRYTRGLFYEMSYEDPSTAIYTLKDKDYKSYISLYSRYLNLEDPYEVTFANTYFEGWEHWQMVANTAWFKPIIERWRKELALRIRAKALNQIREIAKDETSRSSFAANKLLLEGGWMDKEEKAKVGRPSKDEIRKQADNLFELEKEAASDLERITN